MRVFHREFRANRCARAITLVRDVTDRERDNTRNYYVLERKLCYRKALLCEDDRSRGRKIRVVFG